MNPAVEVMLKRYRTHDRQGMERALREIMQEIVLVGLWRTPFFHRAAFYGGTALRILYGLDRFSEDLDFTLLKSDSAFRWKPYEQAICTELEAFGFTVQVAEKMKSDANPVRSAFLKANTMQELIKIGLGQHHLAGLHPDTSLKIKIEIDTSPMVDFAVEERILKAPFNAYVSAVTLENLFAAKMHCAFFRSWKNRVKGRDWYDVVWFIRNGVKMSLDIFSQFLGEQTIMTKEAFLTLADERIACLRIDEARQDVLPFLYDSSLVQRWSVAFFRDLFREIQFQ